MLFRSSAHRAAARAVLTLRIPILGNRHPAFSWCSMAFSPFRIVPRRIKAAEILLRTCQIIPWNQLAVNPLQVFLCNSQEKTFAKINDSVEMFALLRRKCGFAAECGDSGPVIFFRYPGKASRSRPEDSRRRSGDRSRPAPRRSGPPETVGSPCRSDSGTWYRTAAPPKWPLRPVPA